MYTVEFSGGNLDIVSLTVKSCVNPTQELTPGGVCTAYLLLTAQGQVSFSAGTELTLYRDGEKLGIFRSVAH